MWQERPMLFFNLHVWLYGYTVILIILKKFNIELLFAADRKNLHYATLLYDFDRWDYFGGFEDFGDVSKFDWQQDLRGHGGPVWGLPSDEGVARGGSEAHSRGPFLQHKVM